MFAVTDSTEDCKKSAETRGIDYNVARDMRLRWYYRRFFLQCQPVVNDSLTDRVHAINRADHILHLDNFKLKKHYRHFGNFSDLNRLFKKSEVW